MRTFAVLFCFVLLAINRVVAQETFAPLITQDCIAFVHFDFHNIELDTIKKNIQQIGENFLRDLEFDEQSFKSTARELAVELDKADDIIRPYFDTITKDLGIREIAVIFDAKLFFMNNNAPFFVVVPWKNKTDEDLDMARTRLDIENYACSQFVNVGDFLILPWDIPSSTETITNWAKNIKPGVSNFSRNFAS